MKTSAAYLRDTSVVPPPALILLCGDAEDTKVLFGKQRMAMDGGWLEVGLTSKTAVLLLRMRQYISEMLQEKLRTERQCGGWRGGILSKQVLSVGY